MAKRKRTNYRAEVLKLDPKATLVGKRMMMGGRYYDMYNVLDGAGTVIGWVDGNEEGEGWAWMRALGTLQARLLRM